MRGKIVQLLGFGASAFPLIGAFSNDISTLQLAAAAVTAGCSAAATWAINFYGRRYVLEASIVHPDAVLFSSLDFWGRRLDFACHLSGACLRRDVSCSSCISALSLSSCTSVPSCSCCASSGECPEGGRQESAFGHVPPSGGQGARPIYPHPSEWGEAGHGSTPGAAGWVYA